SWPREASWRWRGPSLKCTDPTAFVSTLSRSGALPPKRLSGRRNPRTGTRWPRNRRCDAGAHPKKLLESSCSSLRTTLRTSPGRRSSSMADTCCASHALRRGKGHALHQEGPARSALVTREDEGGAVDGGLLAHEPSPSSPS